MPSFQPKIMRHVDKKQNMAHVCGVGESSPQKIFQRGAQILELVDKYYYQ